MDKKEVIEYFDLVSSKWDEEMIKSEEKIKKILDVAQASEKKSILDVACGTGVLVPDYLDRRIKEYVGIDISSEMIKIARGKFSHFDNVKFICGDAEQLEFCENFDCAVVYNAFPHFVSPESLFKSLHKVLKKGGRVTVAHGMSREALTLHHSGSASKISKILPDTEEMEKFMSPFFKADVKISTDDIYVVSAVKKEI